MGIFWIFLRFFASLALAYGSAYAEIKSCKNSSKTSQNLPDYFFLKNLSSKKFTSGHFWKWDTTYLKPRKQTARVKIFSKMWSEAGAKELFWRNLRKIFFKTRWQINKSRAARTASTAQIRSKNQLCQEGEICGAIFPLRGFCFIL